MLRPRRHHLRLLALSGMFAATAATGCGKNSQLEPGAVLLDVSVDPGVTTPDELRVFVYDDTGALWNDARVPAAGALAPETATHLGTVLIQPGATQGKLRVHVRGFVASARVGDGTLSIPAATRGPFELRLDAALPRDDDGDEVPDAIDDCPGVSNPEQRACPGTSDGGDAGGRDDAGGDAAMSDGRDTPVSDGGEGRDAPASDGGVDGINCDAARACNRSIGAACTDGMQCASSFCVDGVCCGNACVGPCRSCNQPNNDGTCQPYGQGTDPGAECTGGATCNGAGACGAPTGGLEPNGQLCGAATDCASGFCKDGVCCNNACDGDCRTCETGTCSDVKRKPDPPECAGTMTCNPTGKCVLN